MKKCSPVFIVFVILGALLCILGIAIMIINLGKQFSITNLRPIVFLVAGFFIFIIGAIVIEMSFRIKWMRRIEKKIDGLR